VHELTSASELHGERLRESAGRPRGETPLGDGDRSPLLSRSGLPPLDGGVFRGDGLNFRGDGLAFRGDRLLGLGLRRAGEALQRNPNGIKQGRMHTQTNRQSRPQFKHNLIPFI